MSGAAPGPEAELDAWCAEVLRGWDAAFGRLRAGWADLDSRLAEARRVFDARAGEFRSKALAGPPSAEEFRARLAMLEMEYESRCRLAEQGVRYFTEGLDDALQARRRALVLSLRELIELRAARDERVAEPGRRAGDETLELRRQLERTASALRRAGEELHAERAKAADAETVYRTISAEVGRLSQEARKEREARLAERREMAGVLERQLSRFRKSLDESSEQLAAGREEVKGLEAALEQARAAARVAEGGAPVPPSAELEATRAELAALRAKLEAVRADREGGRLAWRKAEAEIKGLEEALEVYRQQGARTEALALAQDEAARASGEEQARLRSQAASLLVRAERAEARSREAEARALDLEARLAEAEDRAARGGSGAPAKPASAPAAGPSAAEPAPPSPAGGPPEAGSGDLEELPREDLIERVTVFERALAHLRAQHNLSENSWREVLARQDALRLEEIFKLRAEVKRLGG